MSHIFDALQRVDDERCGQTTSSRISATELLRRAERQTLAQRNSESRVATIVETAPAREDAEQWLAGSSVGDTSRRESDQKRRLPAEIQTLHLPQPFHFGLVTLSDEARPAAEAFRLLCVRLRHLRKNRPLSRLLVSSTSPEEGKSFIAANLACTLAASPQERVLLLEGDLRRPTQGEFFRLEAMPGLCEFFSGNRNLQDSIYHLKEAGIWFLPAGLAPANSPDLIQYSRLAEMTAQLSHWFDWIIIDSPPILPLADTSIWEKPADGLLLVARQGVTAKRKLKRGIEAIDRSKLIGTILNSSTRSTDEDYYYYKRPSGSSDAEATIGANDSLKLHLL
jgi:capsular exopolysaccharide synthesis family protein